jgi:nucleotide-binding universal stress UspA family protein
MIAIKNVLVATDFSPSSDVAMAYGRALAGLFQARLHIIHVVDNAYTKVFMGEAALASRDTAALQQTLEETGRRQLEAAVSDEDRRKLKATLAVPIGSVAQEIVRYAKAAGIDVIVMGTHGRGMVTHALMGSAAEKVVRLAPCPVLTVKHPEREFVLPEAGITKTELPRDTQAAGV